MGAFPFGRAPSNGERSSLGSTLGSKGPSPFTFKHGKHVSPLGRNKDGVDPTQRRDRRRRLSEGAKPDVNLNPSKDPKPSILPLKGGIPISGWDFSSSHVAGFKFGSSVDDSRIAHLSTDWKSHKQDEEEDDLAFKPKGQVDENEMSKTHKLVLARTSSLGATKLPSEDNAGKVEVYDCSIRSSGEGRTPDLKI